MRLLCRFETLFFTLLLSSTLTIFTIRYVNDYKSPVGKYCQSVYADVVTPIQDFQQEKWCINRDSVQNNTFVEDLLQYNITFLEGFKNPCFYDTCDTIGSVRTKSFHCLPFFHVLGVDKCGSTDLFARLVQHPQILSNGGSLDKETQWWEWKRYGYFLNRSVSRKEVFLDYLKYFDKAAGEILKRTSLPIQNSSEFLHPLITGDGTPMDFWDFAGWPQLEQNKNYSSPVVMTPHLMKHLNPDVKFILIFRNPTDRLYSDYIFLGLGKPNPKSFHSDVVKGLKLLKNCTDHHDERYCLFSRDVHVQLKARLHVSIYSVFLREWFKVFPRDQFLILRTEDYSADIKSHLQKAFDFLGVVNITEDATKNIERRARAHTTVKKRKVGPMFLETKKMLDDFFEPYLKELVNITGDDMFMWSDIKNDESYISSKHYKKHKQPKYW